MCNAIKIAWESKDYRYVNISEEQETVIGPYIHESCFVVEKKCNAIKGSYEVFGQLFFFQGIKMLDEIN